MRGPVVLRGYLATALAARFAGEGVGLALVLLAVERTGGAAHGAFVLTAWTAPHALAAPLAGAVAARARRPRLFYTGALVGFGTALAGLALLVGRAPAAVVAAVAVAGGACGPVVTGALSSLVARLIPAGPVRDRAYAWDAATYNAASVTAPAVVGTIAAARSGAWSMAALASAAALGAVLAALLPYGRRGGAGPATAQGAGNGGSASLAADGATDPATTAGPGGPHGPGSPVGPGGADESESPDRSAGGPGRANGQGGVVAAGLVALWRVRELRAITSATSLAFLGLGALTTTAVLLADRLGGGSGSGSVLMTAFAVGALTGALGLTRLSLPAGRLAEYAMTGTGLALVAASWAPSLPVAAALFAVAGVCDGPLLAATLRIRADHAPDGAREQVFTLGAGLKMTAASAGAAAAGFGAALPPAWLLAAIGAVQLAAAALHRALARTPAPSAEAAPALRSAAADPAAPRAVPGPRDRP
ncbi:MFS transporter [Streptomyces sp. NPDC086023]|uniref:MFS transporter n=1 Tax=Streptomyces sp. NPDC086023 TaxID=3365746 RepID=UPI0037D6A59C